MAGAQDVQTFVGWWGSMTAHYYRDQRSVCGAMTLMGMGPLPAASLGANVSPRRCARCVMALEKGSHEQTPAIQS